MIKHKKPVQKRSFKFKQTNQKEIKKPNDYSQSHCETALTLTVKCLGKLKKHFINYVYFIGYF
jgi:hypothetical protein